MSAIKDFYIEAAELLIKTIHDVYSEGVGVDPYDCDWKHPTASNPFEEVESRFLAAAPITMGQRWEFMRTETDEKRRELFNDLFAMDETTCGGMIFREVADYDADMGDMLSAMS